MSEPAQRLKLTGVCPPAQPYVLAELMHRHPAPVWLVIHEEAQHVDSLAEDVALFHQARDPRTKLEILTFPEAQTDSRDMREAFNAASDRLSALSRLRGASFVGGGASSPGKDTPASGVKAPRLQETLFVLATPAALLQPVPPLADFATREIELKRGTAHSFQGLLDLLQSFDYDSEAVCEAPGQYAVRGGIVDVYPITAHQPCRLDFFGDNLEEMRALDPVTQRSGEPVASIVLTAAPRLHASAAHASLLDYLHPAAHVVLLEPKSLEELFHSLAPDEGGARTPFRAEDFPAGSGVPALPFLAKLPQAGARLIGIGDLDLASHLFDGVASEETWDTESLSHHRAYPEEHLLAHERLQVEEDSRRAFLTKVAAWNREGYAVDFVVSKEGEEQRVRELLEEHATLKGIKPRFLRGAVSEGFRVTFRDGKAGPPYPRSSAMLLSPKRRYSAAAVSGDRGPGGPPPRNRRSTSCSISPSWSKATSSCTFPTASRSTGD